MKEYRGMSIDEANRIEDRELSCGYSRVSAMKKGWYCIDVSVISQSKDDLYTPHIVVIPTIEVHGVISRENKTIKVSLKFLIFEISLCVSMGRKGGR